MFGQWIQTQFVAGSLSSRSRDTAVQFRAPVRDLYGTMPHEGATKGILVSAAEFEPSAQKFAAGKPLTLISGSQLVDLLAKYGI